MGTVVGKKLGGATQRNRCKRRFRELARLSLGGMAAGWDVLILPKRQAAGVPAPRLRMAWNDALARAGLMRREETA